MISYGHLPIITVQTVATMLGVPRESASKWLKQNDIPIHKISKKGNVFQIDVAVAIDKIHARDLKIKYPSTWEERYQIEANDPKVCQLVIQELKGETWTRPSTIVKPINESDNKILKRLL
ncbi:MAG: helix-turn-helix domain-containing protein [Bacteroidetes bacterium]|nr:helix-turn-helix domain-containing protein [Bacteroidota bacterium]